jgi:hypothetical protein
MKIHLRVLGVIYFALGAFIAAFALVVGYLGAMSYFGKDAGVHQDASEALTVFMVLIFPATWIVQTGVGLYRAQRSARLWGIATAAIFLIGLNLLLLQLNAQSDRTGRGFFVFHLLMILIGLYSLAVLLPKRVTAHLQ